MSVTEYKVARLTTVPFPDGRTLVAEGLDYVSDCGCRFTFGIRFDKNEKCLVSFPCDSHDAALGFIEESILQAAQPHHPDYEKPTTELLEGLLV